MNSPRGGKNSEGNLSSVGMGVMVGEGEVRGGELLCKESVHI